jgi:hypothetical protein
MLLHIWVAWVQDDHLIWSNFRHPPCFRWAHFETFIHAVDHSSISSIIKISS